MVYEFELLDLIKEVGFSLIVAGITGTIWFGFRQWRGKHLYEKIICVIIFTLLWIFSALLLWLPTILLMIQIMIVLDGSLYLATSQAATIFCFGVALFITFFIIYAVMRFLMKRISATTVQRFLG